MNSTLDFIHEYVPPAHPGGRTILLLHGTGGDERDLLPIGQWVAPGAGYLSPRGKVLEHGMPRFFRRLAEGVFDLEDLHSRTAELREFLRQASETYHFAAEELYAVGYSNGANIAASMFLTDPATLAGAVLLRPMLPFTPETRVTLAGKPIFIAAGQQDRVIPRESTQALIDTLKDAGATVDARVYPAGHNLLQRELNDARDWLAAQH